MVLQVEPSSERSILYPVIADPPLSFGALQDKLIGEDEIAAAARPVGGCDTVTGELVVADAVFDGELSYQQSDCRYTISVGCTWR